MENILNRFENVLLKNKNKKMIQFTYNYHTENNFEKIKHYKIDEVITKVLGDHVTSYGISENPNNGNVHISIIQRGNQI